MHTVLGIDLGTQSLKVLFYDADARRMAACESAPLNLYQNDDGTAEQQAHWWVNALQEALHKVDPSIRASARAVAVSGQQHGFVPLSASGEVLAPVKLWCDTATTRECDEIMDRFGGRQACIDQVGNPILPGYTASKIAWFRRHHPALYTAMDTVLLPHDYLNFLLTGERCMEAGDASGTGFLDIRERRWSTALLEAIDPERNLIDCLPELRLEPGVIGTLQPSAAQQLGLPAGIPVATGGGDNMMGAIGTGNVARGSITMSLGTSGTVYASSDTPVIDPEGEIAAFCSSTGDWLPLLCTMNCTVTTEILRSLLATDIEAFEQRVSRAPRGAGGLLVLPFFNGERTPNLPRARGCIVGMDSQNTQRDNVLRAGLEGATFALRHGIDRLRDLGLEPAEIMLTGGGMKSPTWRQAVADICDAPVTVFEQDEGASFGAALQALAALEETPIGPVVEQHLVRHEALSCTPNPSAVNGYQETYGRYVSAVDAIATLYR
ncbi:MAG: xylulokinase [Pseudomonadota bacterium]